MCNRTVWGRCSKNSNKTLPERYLEVSKLKKHVLIYTKEGGIRKERRNNFFLPLACGGRGVAIVASTRLFHKCNMKAHAFFFL